MWMESTKEHSKFIFMIPFLKYVHYVKSKIPPIQYLIKVLLHNKRTRIKEPLVMDSSQYPLCNFHLLSHLFLYTTIHIVLCQKLYVLKYTSFSAKAHYFLSCPLNLNCILQFTFTGPRTFVPMWIQPIK